MKKFIPDIYKKSVYDINYKNLLNRGIKCLIFDLDNTLVPYSEDIPSTDVKELFLMLSNDFKVILMSNSSKKRLRPFKEILNVDTAFSACKPLKKKYEKILRVYRFKTSEVACIGDQLLTDIYGANNMKLLSILVNPIGKKEPFWTKINRMFEKIVYKKLGKRGILLRGNYYE